MTDIKDIMEKSYHISLDKLGICPGSLGTGHERSSAY